VALQEVGSPSRTASGLPLSVDEAITEVSAAWRSTGVHTIIPKAARTAPLIREVEEFVNFGKCFRWFDC